MVQSVTFNQPPLDTLKIFFLAAAKVGESSELNDDNIEEFIDAKQRNLILN